MRFAQWKYNGKAGPEEEVTHGQVVDLLFHTRCEVRSKNTDQIQLYFDMTSQRLASFFEKFWPAYLKLDWCAIHGNGDCYPRTG